MSLKELAPTYYTRLKKVSETVKAPKRLLNIGSGDGVFDSRLKDFCERIYSMDINRADLQIGKSINPEGYVFYCAADIQAIPCKPDSFDCVLCIEVLEHLDADTEAIRELRRVLSPGGRLIITVPSSRFPFLYDPVNHVLNRYGRKLSIGIWGWGHKRLYNVSELTTKIGLTLLKAERISGPVIGFFENSYLNSFLQRFIKNDPKNQGRRDRHTDRISRMARVSPPHLLLRLRDRILALDQLLFPDPKTSVGLLLVFKKAGP